jgi:NAD(P)-dependent dehydrogenase (short-subunit alcohol dehydrogenase family)
MQINDRVFVVTGASSGIGLSMAVALADRGARGALLARMTQLCGLGGRDRSRGI